VVVRASPRATWDALLATVGGALDGPATRFSTYRLTFELSGSEPGPTRLRATTHADFPGIGGRLYRAAVIGSGAHAVLVRRLLRGVAART
jgi:hypothetical protein